MALTAALLCSAAVAQTTFDVPISDAREIATRALFAGETELALQIAQAILAQQPDDRAALMIVAAAAPRLGNPEAGRQAGARAFAVSTTDIEKYEAARLTALAAANEERFTLATYWLRRALIVAPNDAEEARTLQDARAVSRRNPWSFNVSGSLVPSNNVNGGAESDESSAPGNPTGTLSEDAIALSGWRGSLDFSTQYRLQENPKSRTIAALRYRLSRAWVTEDTTVPNEAFDTESLEFSLRHDRVLESGTISANVTRGVFSYQDLDLAAQSTETLKYDLLRFGLDRRFAVAENAMMTLSYSRENLDYEATGIGEVNRNTFGTSLTFGLASGDQISGSFSYTDSVGDSVNYTSETHSLRVIYGWAEPIGPISLSAGGGIRWADYPDYQILNPVTGGRQDKTLFAEANIGFPDVSYAGFTPGLRVDISDTESNVSRFDRTTFSVGLTVRSQF